jgi:hypothetical protein
MIGAACPSSASASDVVGAGTEVEIDFDAYITSLCSTAESRARDQAEARHHRLELHAAMKRCLWLSRMRYQSDLTAYSKAIGVVGVPVIIEDEVWI